MSDTTKPKRYRAISAFLKEKYGEKVYKLPVALPLTCPNRDGSVGVGGCVFCGEIGAGYENLPASMTVREQLEKNIAHIAPKYKAYKYIPYYQNFSNTYLEPDRFRAYMEAGCIDSTVGIAIATRPDCVDQVKLHALYIVKNTLMAKWYEEKQFSLISADEYIERVIAFLQHLDKDIVLQRLVGRAPEENTLFTNWSMGWWRIQEEIERRLEERDVRQGDLCNYLNGSAVRKFL